MADFYDSRGNYMHSMLYPGTVGYPVNTENMTDEEKESLEPIRVDKYLDDEE